MANEEAAKGGDRCFELRPFSFGEDDRKRLVAVGVEDSKLVDKIERLVAVFLAGRDLPAPTSTRTRESLEALREGVRAVEDALTNPEAKRAVQEAMLSRAAGWRLTDNLNAFVVGVEAATADYKVKTGRPTTRREWLAVELCHLLAAQKTAKLQPKTTETGPYYQCLKVCLQAAGEPIKSPDDTARGYGGDIKRLVGWAVKEARDNPLVPGDELKGLKIRAKWAARRHEVRSDDD